MRLDDILCRILSVGKENCGLTRTVKEEEILALCTKAREVFLNQSIFIEIDPPVRICGDTHGQYGDLLRLFHRGGFPPQSNYLFLGDYVDRGRQNLEVICLMFCYKIKYPNNFFLLRGNHECNTVNRVYGFYDECVRRYNSQRLWQSFQDVFEVMPFTACVGDRILCMHGGISPQLKDFEQLRNIPRPSEPVSPSLEMDLLWSDPVVGISGYAPNLRGASYGFGEDVLVQTCNRLGVDMVARAHQVVQDGYEFFGNRRLVTVFSAPHYCGQFDNAAAIMHVDDDLVCSFQILRPAMGPSHTRLVKTVRDKSEKLTIEAN
uniref:Serine/threonine-protein phosphatase n=2 Tax=Ascaris TaxID=6251 RepID=A0A9J2PFH4_ASCLU